MQGAHTCNHQPLILGSHYVKGRQHQLLCCCVHAMDELYLQRLHWATTCMTTNAVGATETKTTVNSNSCSQHKEHSTLCPKSIKQACWPQQQRQKDWEYPSHKVPGHQQALMQHNIPQHCYSAYCH